jgi:hypothetical protein
VSVVAFAGCVTTASAAVESSTAAAERTSPAAVVALQVQVASHELCHELFLPTFSPARAALHLLDASFTVRACFVRFMRPWRRTPRKAIGGD